MNKTEVSKDNNVLEINTFSLSGIECIDEEIRLKFNKKNGEQVHLLMSEKNYRLSSETIFGHLKANGITPENVING